MPKLNNPSGEDIVGHYAGHAYTIPAKGSLTLKPEDQAAADKLFGDLAVRGVTITPDKKAKE